MAEWTEHDVTANGIRIHYTRTGTGTANGPALVLLHGYSDNGLCWTPVARELEADYDIVMPDARGHGLSEAPEGPYSADAMADDVVALVDALGLERPVLMGHSMGGITAMVAAGRYPDRFGAAILEDPALRLPEEEERIRQEEETRRREYEERRARGEQPPEPGLLEMRAMSREELVALCRRQSPTWPEGELGPWALSKQQVSLNLLKAEWDGGEPWQETAAHITCPVLLIVPDVALGGMTTPGAAELAAKIIKDAVVARIGLAGHNVRREQFALFMDAVRGFLARVAPR
jgi:pimeloyl-ACP methyl ester carboxylesterase